MVDILAVLLLVQDSAASRPANEPDRAGDAVIPHCRSGQRS